MYTTVVSRLLFAFVALLSTHSSTLAATHYVMTELGTLGGSSTNGWGINNVGQSVGSSATLNDLDYHAYISNGNQLVDLGLAAGWDDSEAIAMNDLGKAVGTISPRNGYPYHAAYFPGPGGTVKDLGTFGGLESVAQAINNSALIVGRANNASEKSRAFSYSNGQMNDLGTLPGFDESFGVDVNNAGAILGYLSAPGGLTHTFIYSGGQMTDLDTVGGYGSFPNAINACGEVVGTAQFDSKTPLSAFHYYGGKFHSLGTLGSGGAEALDINDIGDIVGYGYVPGDGNPHAFVCYDDGPLIDLNSLVDNRGDALMQSAVGINNVGQIVCSAGLGRTVLLTPVPEPTALSSLTIGFGLFFKRRRGIRNR